MGEGHIEAIQRSVDTLIRLVDNVVVVGRSEWLSRRAERESLDLVEVCNEIWRDVSRGRSDHRLILGEEGERRPFQGDMEFLRSLLGNLFQNAAKYSPSHEEILVNLIYRPRETVIEVRDFGIGIPQESLKTIFEPFQRARNAESISGSGLGLAIARASARALGGELTVKSRLGEGTSFIVTFPLGGQDVKQKKTKRVEL